MDFLTLNIDPIAFSLGPIIVRWYALAYLFGFVLGWRYALMLIKSIPGERPNTDDIDNFLSWAVVGDHFRWQAWGMYCSIIWNTIWMSL